MYHSLQLIVANISPKSKQRAKIKLPAVYKLSPANDAEQAKRPVHFKRVSGRHPCFSPRSTREKNSRDRSPSTVHVGHRPRAGHVAAVRSSRGISPRLARSGASTFLPPPKKLVTSYDQNPPSITYPLKIHTRGRLTR